MICAYTYIDRRRTDVSNNFKTHEYTRRNEKRFVFYANREQVRARENRNFPTRKS
jgi:hypothetical protein